MYLLYSIIYIVALIFLLPFEYIKRPKELRNRWLRERFGLCSKLQIPNSKLVIWIHAVSVGEVIAAVPLIMKIKDRYPSMEIVISTVTDTGQKVAKERMGDTARIIYMPFDLPFIVRNTVKNIRPSLFIVMETELWPNIIRILSRLGVPVLLMNGRISEKSFNGYKRLRFFIKDVLKDMRLLCMQNESYADRIKDLGAEPGKVRVIGSFKFDTRPFSPIPEWTRMLKCQASGVKGQDFTIIAGSTHRTEEELIIDAYIKLRADFPQINLIVAPRHPERFGEVEELVRKRGLKYVKRSELLISHSSKNTSISHEPSAMSHQLSGVIVILDVIGELASVYGACDIAIMGGTFIEHGGQNPLEPAYWGKAIVCGPHMENFPFIDEFYKRGGALKVEADNLYQSVKMLLNSQEKMLAMGKIAKELYKKNAGATERAVEIVGNYL